MTEHAGAHAIRPVPPSGMGRRVLLALLVWAGLVAFAGISGAASALPTQLIAPLVAIAIAAPVTVYACSPGLRAWCAAVGLWWLTAVHGWRIAAAGVFFWYGHHGLLPAWFVANAGWGDLAAGLLALAVVAWPGVGRRGYWLAHGFGFADFVVAVGTGLTYTLLGDPLMDTIATFPLILIPLFMVGVSGAVHLIAFHLLWTGHGVRTG